jgi:rhamnulokinase
MSRASSFAAVDLGASSGRVMVGVVTGGALEVTEVHRFANRPVRIAGTLYWDVLGVYREVVDGLRAAARHAELASAGVDSWGVDYGLIDGTGALLGNPVHHRDGRTHGIPEKVSREMPPGELYAITGVQQLAINTCYQLAGARGSPILEAAATLLLIPDLIGYWLTGEIGAELTNASTTSLLDARSRAWAAPLLQRFGIPQRLLPPLAEPGTVRGHLRADVLDEVGVAGPLPLVAVASHDTASAVAAVPAKDERFGYISCGTWSLAGIELTAPVLTAASLRAGFTNEAGVDGTIRYLRNIAGLWLLQETLRSWRLAGQPADLAALLRQAADEPGFAAVIDATDPVFLPPGDMPARIADACQRTGQRPPASQAAMVRCILDSLALAHRAVLTDAQRLSGRAIEVIHIVGGGARNRLLCQLTADACGLPVEAGPAEATALGNILVQARAAGAAGPSLADLRALSRGGQRLNRYEPCGNQAAWQHMAACIADSGSNTQ